LLLAGFRLCRLARLVRFARLFGGPFGAGQFVLHAGDELLQARSLAGQSRGAIALGRERLLGHAERRLTGVDERCELLSLQAEILSLLRERGLFRRDRLAQLNEIGKVARQCLGVGPQLRQHRAEQHRGSDRFQHVFGRDQQRRRRPASHPLKRSENFGDQCAAAFQGTADRLLTAVQGIEPGFGIADLVFGGAHLLGRRDQGGGEAGPVAAQIFDVGFDLAPLRLGSLDRVLDALQLGLLGREILGLVLDRWRRRRFLVLRDRRWRLLRGDWARERNESDRHKRDYRRRTRGQSRHADTAPDHVLRRESQLAESAMAEIRRSGIALRSDDRDARRGSSPPDRSARPPCFGRAGAARSWRRRRARDQLPQGNQDRARPARR